jgi:hypothetical protein
MEINNARREQKKGEIAGTERLKTLRLWMASVVPGHDLY